MRCLLGTVAAIALVARLAACGSGRRTRPPDTPTHTPTATPEPPPDPVAPPIEAIAG